MGLPFNRGHFNRPSRAETALYATTSISIGATAAAGRRRNLSAVADVRVAAESSLLRVWVLGASSAINIGGGGDAQRIRIVAVRPANIVVDAVAKAPQSILTDYIAIVGDIPPGGVLVIDTDKMTATLNGENVAYMLTDDSSFFELVSGENKLKVADACTLKVEWKDRWL